MSESNLDPEKEQERLDDLGERIARTRRDAENLEPGEDDEHRFVESGNIGGDEDDQNAAPA